MISKELLPQIPSPCYVMEEALFRNNLSIIKSVADESGAEIVPAFKAFALWKVFPIIREYFPEGRAAVSSPAEARLAYEELGGKAHAYSPAYTEADMDDIYACCSHITFNSLNQYNRFKDATLAKGISCGLRVNPGYSPVETMLYNPCAPNSRLGIQPEDIANGLPEGIEGLHFHVLCESTAEDTEKALLSFEKHYGHLINNIKWLNLGGGHLMTHIDYNRNHLIEVLKAFKAKYPKLHLLLEPGSAFAWQTGDLITTVEDIVINKNIQTAILNVSFTAHMPDCLEMPYKPDIEGSLEPEESINIYQMGGNSCLAGDYLGNYGFEKPLQTGDTLIFKDMIHYTLVKTTMFNGVIHPSIGIIKQNGTFELLRKFGYEDYKNRMC